MLGNERGYTLIEMVVVMAILGVVISSLTTVFVSGSNAEIDLNRRFQAQQQARLALNKIRADLHCATSAYYDSTNNWLKIAETSCSATNVTYCVRTSPNMATRYALYRTLDVTANRCGSADTSKALVADDLTKNTGNFTFNAPDGMLEMISVDFPVSANSTATRDVYELKDTVVLRNSLRCVTGCAQSNYPVSP